MTPRLLSGVHLVSHGRSLRIGTSAWEVFFLEEQVTHRLSHYSTNLRISLSLLMENPTGVWCYSLLDY